MDVPPPSGPAWKPDAPTTWAPPAAERTAAFTDKALIISLIGVLVAALTALRGFYHWDKAWILMRLTEFAITDAYNEWLAEITRHTDLSTEAAAYARREATTRALEKVAAIRRTETASYFKDLHFPQNGH